MSSYFSQLNITICADVLLLFSSVLCAIYCAVRRGMGGSVLRFLSLPFFCLAIWVFISNFQSGSLYFTLLALSLGGMLLSVFEPLTNFGQIADQSLQKFETVILSLLGVAVALFLLIRLDSYSGVMLTWEGDVSKEMGVQLMGAVSPFSYFIKQLRWDDGLVSSGQNSFLYGAFSYLLVYFNGFTLWNLRIMSVFWALLSVPLIYAIGKRFYGPRIAFFSTVLLLTNPLFLYYARYATSLSATLFCVLLSLYASLAILKEGRLRWHSGILTALVFFITTLHYSPARLCVIYFLGFISAAFIFRRGLLKGDQIKAFIILILSCGIIFGAEKYAGSDTHFLRARGEQIFEMLNSAGYIKDYIGVSKPFAELTSDQKKEVVLKILAISSENIAQLLNPSRSIRPDYSGINTVGDPPDLPLVYPFLIPFILWAFVFHIFRKRDYRRIIHVILPLWVFFVLLFTNRADDHRAFVLVVPLTFLAAFAIENIQAKLLCNGFRSLLWEAILSLNILVMCIFPFTMLRTDEGAVPPVWISKLKGLIDSEALPVRVAMMADQKESSWINLALIEKNRLLKRQESYLYQDSTRDKLSDEKFNVVEAEAQLRYFAVDSLSPLGVFAPAVNFSKFRALMIKNNCEAWLRTIANVDILILKKCPTQPERRPQNPEDSEEALDR